MVKNPNIKLVGFVALIGRPGSGKSTLINSLIGEKVSIVSSVPQTTRNQIRAIYQDDESQIIFFDTPGYHLSEKKFNKRLLSGIDASIKEADCITYIIDISRPFGEEEQNIIDRLQKVKQPVIVLINKSDLVDHPQEEAKKIEKHIESLKKAKICVVSALKKQNLDACIDHVKLFLKKGIPYYPEDYYTDQPFDFRISEIIREKVFQYTKEEIPHCSYVEVTDFEEKEKKDLLILHATIHVERDSQKKIIIGTKGAMITKIGTSARKDLEKIYDRKIYLNLVVKVKKKWRRDERVLKKMFTKT